MDIGLQQGRGGAIWLYAGTEDVADDGEHGYRRAERTYAPWQGRRDAIWLYAGTEDVADDVEHGYRPAAGAGGRDMPLRRYRGRRGRRRAWISAYREDVCAVAGAEGCDTALRRYRGRRERRRAWISACSRGGGCDMALRRYRGRRGRRRAWIS